MRVPLPPTASPIKSALALAMLGVLALPCFGQDGHRVNPRPKPRTPQERPADPALAEDPAESDAEAPRDLLSQPAPAGEIPAPLPPPLPADSLLLGDHHHTGAIREGGSWTLDSSFIAQDQDLEYQATLTLRSPGLWYWLPKTKGVYLVVLAQRLFDGQGVYSAGSSGMGTTLLTPTGIPVVSAAPGNPTDAFGGAVRHPGNRFLLVAPDALERMDDQETVVARFLHTIPAGSELPPGWYRFTAQFGVQLSAREFTTLQGANPADLLLNTTTDSAVRYPLTAVKTAAELVLPAALFGDVHPGGGAFPDALQRKVGITGREGFYPQTILAPFDPDGSQRRYRLDLSLPWLQGDGAAEEFPLQLIPTGGSVDIAIRTPDGALLDLGPSAITGLDAGAIATDRTNGEFAFSRYGRHTITVDGTLADADGIQYRIGGDYSAWVAMPLDLRVATLPGTPAVRGEAFTMAVRCYPPVPAKIRATQWVSVAGSNEVKEHGYEVQASPAGEFIPALRNTRNRWWGKGLVLFEDAGEYRLRVQGSYESADGTLYLGQWESANVVVPPTGSARTTPALVAAFGGLGATVAPTLDQGLDFPLVATDLLFIAPGRRPFDPWLYGHGEPDLIERRLIPAGNLVDLTSGQRGFVPASGTPQGYPAQGYPESRDRMGLTYAWAVAPGLKPRSVVRDGTADGDRRPVGPALEWNAPARYTLFGGVSLFDATLEQGAQGAYAGGLIVSDKVNRFSLLPTGSDADALSDRPIPYLHQWAIPAGTVLPQGAAFSPQCYVFPPQSGTLHVTLKRAAGPERYLEVPIDARGVAGSLQGFAPLEQPGVYTVAPSAQLAETMLKPDPYQIYVAGRDPDFTMTLQQPPGMRVDWGDALTLSGSIAGEGYQQAELFFTLVVDGELIEQGQVIAATRDFRVDFHLPRAAALLPGFDPAGPHLADLTLFAIPLTGEGELSSCALRATIRDGKLEWSNTPPAKKKKKFWDIF